MHHTIEERHIFPFLAERMPEFSTQTDEGHIDSHKGIHAGSLPPYWTHWFLIVLQGLEELSTLVHNVKKEPSTYSPEQMRRTLDGFRDVLFSHLDQEVCPL